MDKAALVDLLRRLGLRSLGAFASLSEADVVIEAVFESMEVKLQVFDHLDRVMKDGAVLATNTSYLDIDAIAASMPTR